MNAVKKLGLASGLAFGLMGMAQAGSVCSGFQVKLKNTLPDDFVITNVQMTNGNLQPGAGQTLRGKSEQIFVVNDASKKEAIFGEFSLSSVSLPVKNVKIKFRLKDHALYCGHHTQDKSGDYTVKGHRSPGRITYTLKG